MDALERDRILDEGALRLEAAVFEAQRLLELGSEEFWAAALEIERIRVEVESVTGVSLVEPAPPHLMDACVEGAGRVAADQVREFLEAGS